MQPNTLAAPRRLMHDVTPPYADTFARQPQPARPTSATQAPQLAPVAAAPQQPLTPAADPQPAMFPVHTEADEKPSEQHQTPMPPAQPASERQNIQPQHQPSQPAMSRPKTNWLIIAIAVLVATGLAAAAYYAYKGQLGGGKLLP